ncbi:MAG TPA: hypothetical protein VE780_10830 [Thermoleophilaceae bacterium]|jgi:hypothetical protein|nr:hypothetical protein [Thermoleophilaceae bacterium]
MLHSSPRTALACALAVVASLGLAACESNQSEVGLKSPAREGLAIPLEGVNYNVFITRELNLRIQPDQAYYKGPEPPGDQTLYGVFLQVCNKGKTPRPTARDFTIVDNQGNTFHPTPLPADNPFAYHPATLPAGQCIPAPGSPAQQGPTAGAMLLFRLPLANTENRPLALHIIGPVAGPANARVVDLDI